MSQVLWEWHTPHCFEQSVPLWGWLLGLRVALSRRVYDRACMCMHFQVWGLCVSACIRVYGTHSCILHGRAGVFESVRVDQGKGMSEAASAAGPPSQRPQSC